MTEKRRIPDRPDFARRPGPLVRPDLSIIIVSWNTCRATLDCLDSIPIGISDDLQYEVVLVDNGSRDGSAAALAARNDIQLIANDENVGYAAAVNQAYREAGSDFILLLNSDIEFRPGAVSSLMEFLSEHPEVAGVGPLYLNPDGTPQQHHYRFPTFWATLAGASSPLRRLPWLDRSLRRYRMLDDDFSRAQPVEQPSASCLLLRRTCLPESDVYDERYPIYFNDVALAHSLQGNGHELWMTPKAVVLHEHGASTRLLGGALARQHIGAHILFLRETQPWYWVLAFRVVVFVQKTTLAVLRRPGALRLRDLWGALLGDPGPLPSAPQRS